MITPGSVIGNDDRYRYRYLAVAVGWFARPGQCRRSTGIEEGRSPRTAAAAARSRVYRAARPTDRLPGSRASRGA